MTAETLERANELKLEIGRIESRLMDLNVIYNGVIKNQDHGMKEMDVEFNFQTSFGGYLTISTKSAKITTENVLDFVTIEIKAMTERKAALEKEFDEL